jgi:DNA-binding response OmpR family regulator
MASTLVLHEDSDCRDLIRRILQENGHQAATFSDQEKALAWARSNDVDLVILSIDFMKDDSSWWLELRRFNKDLKILLLAQYANKTRAKKALQQGADDYLLKPIEIEGFEARVKDLLTEETGSHSALNQRKVGGGKSLRSTS